MEDFFFRKYPSKPEEKKMVIGSISGPVAGVFVTIGAGNTGNPEGAGVGAISVWTQNSVNPPPYTGSHRTAAAAGIMKNE
ncbi:MAG: hypothetical protein HYW64_01010 [Candidatus Levybacteria bacterium]|nr:hypothetical protein [Candidatus Levybacteria bacterium]